MNCVREIDFDYENPKRKNRELDEIELYDRMKKHLFEPQEENEKQFEIELEEQKESAEQLADKFLEAKKQYEGDDFEARVFLEGLDKVVEGLSKGVANTEKSIGQLPERPEAESFDDIFNEVNNENAPIESLEELDQFEKPTENSNEIRNWTQDQNLLREIKKQENELGEQRDLMKEINSDEEGKEKEKSFEQIEAEVFREREKESDQILDGIIKNLKEGNTKLTKGEDDLVRRIKEDLNAIKKGGWELTEEWLHLEGYMQEINNEFEKIKQKEKFESKRKVPLKETEAVEQVEKLIAETNKDFETIKLNKEKWDSESEKTFENLIDSKEPIPYFRESNEFVDKIAKFTQEESREKSEYSIRDSNSKLIELKEIFQGEFLENVLIENGIGIAVPMEFVKEGGLCKILNEVSSIEDFYIRNPELGPFFKHFQEEFQLKPHQMLELLGMNSRGSYFNILNNRQACNLKMLLRVAEYPRFQKENLNNLATELKNQLERFLSSEKKNFKYGLLKHPELGPYLDQLRKNLGIGCGEFSKLIGKHPIVYKKVIKNELGIDIQKLSHLFEHPRFQIDNKINEIEKEVSQVLLSEKSLIYKHYKDKINWQIDNLSKFKMGNRDYVFLPLSNYNVIDFRETSEVPKIQIINNLVQIPDIKELLESREYS